MSQRDGMSRRDFIPASVIGTGLGLASEAGGQSSVAVERAARAVGRLPRRRLGSGPMEISVLVGAGTWDAGAVEAGIRCGINFWHKASAWTWGGAPPAIAKNRDAGRMSRDPGFMKRFPPGTTPHQALTRRLTTESQIDSSVIQINGLEEFADTFSGAGRPVRAADREAIRRMTAFADREVCRLCNECLGRCRHGVQIADILRYERYAIDDRDRILARRLYSELSTKADVCVACGTCGTSCPHGLAIRERLAVAHRLLG